MIRLQAPGYAPRRSKMRRFFPVLALPLMAASCIPSSTDNADPATSGVPSGRVVVDMAVSSEKVSLLTDLAKTFNDDKKLSTFKDDAGKDKRAFVRVRSKSSGGTATLLSSSWDESVEGPRPVIWSPAASSWGAIANQRLQDKGQPAIAPTDAKPFMLTPLVIAMPEPMARALGYPNTAIGYRDLLTLANDPQGWASKGHPEWGQFKLGKTNPNFSTSGLSATIAQYYAATAKTSGLNVEDLNKPEVRQFATDVESSVVHYGDITMTFLNNWFRADAKGTSLTYVSAVAIEEKSLIDYNSGNPDGILDPGEVPRAPRIPLVAIYPKEGTLFSDNPFYILDASWVDASEKAAARAFESYVQTPDNQRRVLEFGFRPGNPAVAVGEPITTKNGADPNQPSTALEVPEPKVLVKLLDLWASQRKGARVLLVIDVSGSMGESGDGKQFGETKLDLAKRAAISSLSQFKSDDEVGLRIFTNDIGGAGIDYQDLVPVAAMGSNREVISRKIDELIPLNGTPLYTTAQASLNDMKKDLDPKRINAVVLLTDGMNDDGNVDDDDEQLRQLLEAGRVGAEGLASAPVRIFPIAYGDGADINTLRRIAESTTATVYDASDPKSIEKVFTAVISNF